MKDRLLFFIFSFILITYSIACADDLIEGKTYRFERTFYNLKLHHSIDDNKIGDVDHSNESDAMEKNYFAWRNSKFVIVDSSDDYYVIRFIYINNPIRSGLWIILNRKVRFSTVKKWDEYRLKRKLENHEVEKSISETTHGPVSGPLIVPFKYRIDDKSLSGEATIGYYAGYTKDVVIPFTDWPIPFTPFISAGLSQVSVADENDELHNMSAFTWAIGFLIKDWGDLTIGLAYGEDRTGQQDYVHEGDGWFSFMVGWNF